MDGQPLPASFADFLQLSESAGGQAFLGFIFFAYAADRLIEMLRCIKAYGTYPFDRRYGITSNMMCATNGTIAMIIVVAILEAATRGAEVLWLSAGNESARVVSLAYNPILFLCGVLALLLMTYVYWNMVRRHREFDDPKTPLSAKLSKLRFALKQRGVTQTEIFIVPISSIILSLTSWFAPFFVSAFA